jgi:hypothetical protein
MPKSGDTYTHRDADHSNLKDDAPDSKPRFNARGESLGLIRFVVGVTGADVRLALVR